MCFHLNLQLAKYDLQIVYLQCTKRDNYKLHANPSPSSASYQHTSNGFHSLACPHVHSF